MGNNLFVTGFPYELSQQELGRLFEPCGTVASVKILLERGTGRSRGIAFVVMSTDAEARKAIESLNGTQVGHRQIFVSEARPAKPEGGYGEARPAQKPAGGYTGPERRSGKDRRASAAAPSERRKPWDKESKPWSKDKKPWSKDSKPWSKDKKPWSKGSKPWSKDKKPWSKDAKPWSKDSKPWAKKPGPGEKKPWEKRPGDAKKPWGKKPAGGGKKWGAGGPQGGRKPGDRMSKPGGFKHRPDGGYRAR